jgi:hypothetical protein
MSQSKRFLLRGIQGRHRHNFNWPEAITSRQAVVQITAGEAKQPANPSLGPGGVQEWMYNLGDANIWVSNISPHFNDHFIGEPGGVEFIVNVDFPQPLDVGVTITVEDTTPVEIGN